MIKALQNTSIVALLLVLVGCNTLSSSQKWPSDLPERTVFVDKFLMNRDINVADSKVIDIHLKWIVRFYKGTVLYPNGWNRVSERFIASMDRQEDKAAMATRLSSLGISIANEWAQDNDIRRINSTNIATWGSALRTSAEQNDQIEFIKKIELDVKALIEETLQTNEISYERYYPDEDYDDF